MMKVFTNNKFEGFWPVGSAAVIIAEDKESAARLLSNQLSDIGLNADIGIDNMIEINTEDEQVIILCDGDY